MELLPFVFVLIFLYCLYWTIRYAVRHALADADERRSGGSQEDD